MADEQFYTILTNVGKAKVANAALLNSNVTLKTLKIGDGNGAYYNPTEDQKELRNVVYTCNVGSVSVDKDNPNWIIAETIIPGSVGGFTIREVGLFDTEGDMIAIGKYPETYKPVVANGASKDLNVRTIFEVSNAASVNLSINPSVIIATKEDISNLQKQITSNDNDIAVLSNPNLLINGDFQIWQRGTSFSLDSSYTGEGINMYTADRWKCYLRQGYTVKPLGAYGIRIDVIGATTTDLGCYLRQPFENTNLIGQLVTSQIKIKNVSNMRLAYLGNSDYIGIKLNSNTTYAFTHHMKNDSSYNYYNQFMLAFEIIDTNIDAYVEIEWAKLELGDKATPFYPRLYGEELALCKRYYVPLDYGTHTGKWHHGYGQCNSNYCWLFIPLIMPMRIIPTLVDGAKVASNWTLISNGVQLTLTGVTVRSNGGNGILLQFAISDTGLKDQVATGYYDSDTLGGLDSEIY